MQGGFDFWMLGGPGGDACPECGVAQRKMPPVELNVPMTNDAKWTFQVV